MSVFFTPYQSSATLDIDIPQSPGPHHAPTALAGPWVSLGSSWPVGVSGRPIHPSCPHVPSRTWLPDLPLLLRVLLQRQTHVQQPVWTPQLDSLQLIQAHQGQN